LLTLQPNSVVLPLIDWELRQEIHGRFGGLSLRISLA
jgi:hypothetical protein